MEEWQKEYHRILDDMRIRGRQEGRNGNIEAMRRHLALRPGEVSNRGLYETGLRLHGLLPGQTRPSGGTDGSRESSQSRRIEEQRREQLQRRRRRDEEQRREEERQRRRREAQIIAELEERRRIQAEIRRRREEEAARRVPIINDDVELEVVEGRVVGPGDEYTDYEVGRVVDMEGGKRKNTRKRSNKRKNIRKRSNKRLRRKNTRKRK